MTIPILITLPHSPPITEKLLGLDRVPWIYVIWKGRGEGKGGWVLGNHMGIYLDLADSWGKPVHVYITKEHRFPQYFEIETNVHLFFKEMPFKSG